MHSLSETNEDENTRKAKKKLLELGKEKGARIDIGYDGLVLIF